MKEAATEMVQPLDIIWRPQPDLNRCCRRERPVSWTRLDDGDAIKLYVSASPTGL